MCTAADQKIPVDFVMDDRTASWIKICCTSDVISIKIKFMTKKETDLADFVFNIDHLNFFDVDVQIQIHHI